MGCDQEAEQGRPAQADPALNQALSRTRRLLPAAFAAALALAVLRSLVPASAQPADADDAVRHVVLDIISFTRWPTALPQFNLCVLGPARYAGGLLGLAAQVAGTPIVSRTAEVTDDQLGILCNIVYEGALLPAQREAVLRRLAGHPVLTIGEAVPGCTDLTMFCLTAAGNQVFFTSNIDAIARSGVRLNPRVLMLGRHGPAAP